MRFWTIICLSFLIYSVSKLFEEKYNVFYKLEEQYSKNEKTTINNLICLNLVSIVNRATIDLDYLDQYLYEYIENRKKQIPNFNNSKINDYMNIIKIIKTKNYFINKNLLCLIFDDKIRLNEFDYFFLDKKYYSFNLVTFEFLHRKKLDHVVNEIIVINKEYPYSICLNNLPNKLKILNSCIKSLQRLSKYYYNGNESGRIDLKYDDRNESIIDNENYCLKQLKYNDCIISYSSIKFENKSNTTVFKAYPLIGNFNFWTQFIGLICLILNISIYYIPYKIELILKSNNRKIKFYFQLIKLAIFFISLIFSIIRCNQLISNHLERKSNPTRREFIISGYSKIDNLIMCIPFHILIEDKQLDKTKFIGKSYLEIEKLLDSKFNRKKIKIFLEFQNMNTEIEWKLTDQVIFKGLKRCYFINMFTIRIRYQILLLLLSLSKLSINCDYNQTDIYLLNENEEFNSNTFKYDHHYTIISYEIKRSKLNRKIKCKNYQEINGSSKNRLIDKCIDKRFKIQFNATFNETIINKNDFTKLEWSTARFLIKSNELESLFYKKTKLDCENENPVLECSENFLRSSVLNSNLNNDTERKLYLNYENYYLIEEEISIYKLLFDLLNIQIILFGLNIFRLMNLIFKFINFNQYKLSIIYLICSIGFIYHLSMIFNEILNNDLIYSQYYKLENNFQMPNLIFCFEFDLLKFRFESQFQFLTTNNLSLIEIFNKIKYLDTNNKWLLLELDDILNNTNHEFKLNTYFFLDKKCIEMKLNMNYNENQFYFNNNNDILKIYFNKKFIHQIKGPVDFLTKIDYQLSYTDQFSLVNRFSNFKELVFNTRNRINPLNSIIINQELIEIQKFDKFSLIKNPLQLIYGENYYLNEVNQKLIDLLKKFKRDSTFENANRTMFEIDYHFKKFINLTKNPNYQNIRSNLNFKKLITINHFISRPLINLLDEDFTFSLIFFKRVILITNQENFSKLLLHLLNALSFWINLGILDLYKFFYLIKFNLSEKLIRLFKF